MEHGGDIYSYGNNAQGELLDFSSNINPLGPPEGLKEYLMEGYSELMQYPDIKYRNLRKEVSDYLGCGVENVVVGNGAVEIIDSFILDAERVILMEPCFSEYGLRAWVHGKELVTLDSGEGLQFNLDAFIGKLQTGDLVILGNPNNPTGLRLEKDSLLKIYKHVMESGAYLLLDEAFFEFAPEDYDSIELFREFDYKNIGIIRAATKFYALPGIRLGYACAEKKMAEKVRNAQLPWSVNSMANRAGSYIFKDKEYIKKSKEYIRTQREYLSEELKKIEGLYPYPSHSNYILIRLDGSTDTEMFEKLLEEGIMIRKCKSFRVLSDNHIRVAVKDEVGNKKLLEALNKIVGKDDGR